MVYGGRIDTTDRSNDNAIVDKLVGTRITSSIGHWTFGAGYARGDITSEDAGISDLNSILTASSFPKLLDEDNPVNFASLGLTYDNGDWLFMAEHGRARVDNLYPDSEGQYITVAKRFDKLQPYINYGHSYTTGDGQRNDIANVYYSNGFNTFGNAVSVFNTAQRSMTYGVRYDFMTGIDIKFEYEHIYDFENGGLYYGFTNPDDPIGNGDITTISIDAVF
jgi:hypothetical protein